MAKTLSICEQGYRASAEEQDDTIVWITHMLRKSETETSLLLRGSAVNYANASQGAPPLSFGDWTQRHPANLARDLARFIADGGKVFASGEDLSRYGLEDAELVAGVEVVDWGGVVSLMQEHPIIMNW
jgi:hypothetical protein